MSAIADHEQADREFQASLHGHDISKKSTARRHPQGTTTGLLAFRYSPAYDQFMGANS